MNVGVVLWTIVILAVSVGVTMFVTMTFTRALGTMRTVKLEPEQIDDTPYMRCQECGEVWIDGTPPIHNGACAVAYVKGEQRKMLP